MVTLKDKVVALHKEGKTRSEIKSILNCSSSTIQYALKGRDRAIQRREELRNECREYIKQVKTNAVCIDCKVNHPHWVLQFDHLGNKVFNVGEFARHTSNVETVKTEIAKCDIVCANCHASRTYSRLNLDA